MFRGKYGQEGWHATKQRAINSIKATPTGIHFSIHLLTPHYHASENIDIIRKILLKVVEDPVPGEQQLPGHLNHAKDLMSMALCCKAFLRPSLDLLWSGMTDIVPLLKILAEGEQTQSPLVRYHPAFMSGFFSNLPFV